MLTLESVICNRRIEKAFLNEGVSDENPFLEKGIRLWLDNPKATHLIVSVKPTEGWSKGKEREVNKLAFSESDFNELLKDLYIKWGNNLDISAIHDKSQLSLYPQYEKIMKEREALNKPEIKDSDIINIQSDKDSNANKSFDNSKLNAAKANNKKIITTLKANNLPINDLVKKDTDSRGRTYYKATDKLNNLRKELFGEDLDEDVEIHTTLNPKLFNENEELLPEVKTKVKAIVDKFVEYAKEKGVDIILKDVVLMGSNANYNYKETSDFDLHLIVDDSSDCSQNHLSIIYDALKSMFNDKYDISLNGIDVEVYVQSDYPVESYSAGVYSLENGWINTPSISKIPKINNKKLNSELRPWIIRYNKIIKNKNLNEINSYIDDIYDLRKTSILKDGEFGIGNLVFKELRNLKYLDNLKTVRDELISKDLSL